MIVIIIYLKSLSNVFVHIVYNTVTLVHGTPTFAFQKAKLVLLTNTSLTLPFNQRRSEKVLK